MTVFRNDDAGIAATSSFDGGRIVRYDKSDRTPDMRHIDYGLGVFDAGRVRRATPDGARSTWPRCISDLLAEDDLAGYEVPERFYEIGSPAGLDETRRSAQRRQEVTT